VLNSQNTQIMECKNIRNLQLPNASDLYTYNTCLTVNNTILDNRLLMAAGKAMI